MQAFHSFWSIPNAIRNYDVVEIPDFELLTMILSALEWKKHNGPMYMITDTPGARYFERLGMDTLWDEIRPELDGVDSEVDPFLFWAAGKLYALRSMKTPAAMLDTDLIIWKNMEAFFDKNIVVAHREDINPDVYPDPDRFLYKEGYGLKSDWDRTEPASNTAFLYIPDEEFKNYYTAEAIRFLNNIRPEGLNPVTAMCFAEQRMLAMCAKEKGFSTSCIVDLSKPEEQNLVTHTWGFKQIMRDNPKACEEFCMRCVKRIMEEFPEQEAMLSSAEPLKKYISMYRNV